MAQLVAIGLTAVAIQPIIAYAPGTLIGAIAPVSFSMVCAAFVFGLSMQVILGCGSGTLVNAGSGNLIALAALPLFCVGSFLGTLLVPFAIEATPHVPISLTETFGVSGGVAFTLLGLIGLGMIAARYSTGALWNKKLLVAGSILAGLAVLRASCWSALGCRFWIGSLGGEGCSGTWLGSGDCSILDTSNQCRRPELVNPYRYNLTDKLWSDRWCRACCLERFEYSTIKATSRGLVFCYRCAVWSAAGDLFADCVRV